VNAFAGKLPRTGLQNGIEPVHSGGEKAMKETHSNFWRKIFSKPDTQPSLFHYIKQKPDPGVFENMDWTFLFHPVQAFKEGWNSPRTKPSLFHYLNEDQKTHLTLKEFFSDLVTGFRNPLFIPSVFCDPEGLMVERTRGRTRKWEASMVSLFIHVMAFSFLVYMVTKPGIPANPDGPQVEVITGTLIAPQFDSIQSTKPGGGDDGGSGNHADTPASPGRIPDFKRAELVPPDPEVPRPLLPVEDFQPLAPSIQIPLDITQNQEMPVGDITAPPTPVQSLGLGSGGNPGDGHGPGTGSRSGRGIDIGSHGPGAGSGPGGPGFEQPKRLSEGVKEPVPLVQPLPPYTEEARKAHIEGVVVLEAVILRNGTVTNFKVLRGLGYGLDQSAIDTIASKWLFRPGAYNGSAVDVIATIEVRFHMY
jgi:TonB family protein